MGSKYTLKIKLVHKIWFLEDFWKKSALNVIAQLSKNIVFAWNEKTKGQVMNLYASVIKTCTKPIPQTPLRNQTSAYQRFLKNMYNADHEK